MSFSINGLVSGLDTTQIIADLMKIEKMPYDRLETKKTDLQTQQGVFRTINTKLKTLETTLNDLRYDTSYSINKATSSNSNALSVTTAGGAIAGQYNIEVTKLAKAHRITTEPVNGNGTEWKSLIQDNGLTIGGQKIVAQDVFGEDADIEDMKDSEALAKLTSYLNNNTDKFGVRASIININSSATNPTLAFTLTSTKEGVSSAVTIENETESGTTDLISKFDSELTVDGRDAELTINGMKVTRGSNEISDLIPSVTLNLLKEENTVINVSKDVDKIAENIEKFVTAYNDLITVLKSNLSKPEDEELTNPLQGDSMLKTINSQLYSMFNEGVNIGGNTVSTFMEDIGLSIDKGITTPNLMTGKITFDKIKFTEEMKSNPEKVVGLLTQENTGIFNSMYNKINGEWTSSVSGLLNSKITGYDSELKVVDERMEAMERSLTLKETRLKLQFSNMEVMLSSLQNEQKWLSSQFESLLAAAKNK